MSSEDNIPPMLYDSSGRPQYFSAATLDKALTAISEFRAYRKDFENAAEIGVKRMHAPMLLAYIKRIRSLIPSEVRSGHTHTFGISDMVMGRLERSCREVLANSAAKSPAPSLQ